MKLWSEAEGDEDRRDSPFTDLVPKRRSRSSVGGSAAFEIPAGRFVVRSEIAYGRSSILREAVGASMPTRVAADAILMPAPELSGTGDNTLSEVDLGSFQLMPPDEMIGGLHGPSNRPDQTTESWMDPGQMDEDALLDPQTLEPALLIQKFLKLVEC